MTIIFRRYGGKVFLYHKRGRGRPTYLGSMDDREVRVKALALLYEDMMREVERHKKLMERYREIEMMLRGLDQPFP